MNEIEQEVSAEWLTLGEAAERLNVDGGSLRRWAKRPHIAAQFEGRTRAAMRATRTGTRAATLYPFALVSSVWLASRDGEPVIVSAENVNTDTGGNEGETREEGADRDTDAGSGPVLVADQLTRAYLAMMTQELRERVAEQAATIADLRADKKQLQTRVEQLEAMTAPPEIQNHAPEAQNRPESGDTGSSGQVEAPATQEAQKPARKWFEFWKGDR